MVTCPNERAGSIARHGPVGFGSSVLSGRARAIFLVEERALVADWTGTSACAPLLAQAVGGSSTSGERQGCATHALPFFAGRRTCQLAGDVEDCDNPVPSRGELVSSRAHEALLRRRAFRSLVQRGHRRTPGCTDLVKAPSACTARFRSLPRRICVSFVSFVSSASLMMICLPRLFTSLRACGPAAGQLGDFCPTDMHGSLGARPPPAHQPSTRLEQALHPQHSQLSPRPLAALRVEDWACRAENLGLTGVGMKSIGHTLVSHLCRKIAGSVPLWRAQNLDER